MMLCLDGCYMAIDRSSEVRTDWVVLCYAVIYGIKNVGVLAVSSVRYWGFQVEGGSGGGEVMYQIFEEGGTSHFMEGTYGRHFMEGTVCMLCSFIAVDLLFISCLFCLVHGCQCEQQAIATGYDQALIDICSQQMPPGNKHLKNFNN